MIDLAMKYIRDLASQADGPKVLATGDPSQVVYYVDGDLHVFSKPRPPRAHRIERLSDLVAFANREDGFDPEAVSVWVDTDNGVIVAINDKTASDHAVFKLAYTDRYSTVRGLAGGAWLCQRDFVRLLAFDLMDCLAPVSLLEKVRKVRFENSTATMGDVRRDRESMGQTIASRVEAAAGDLPEYVYLVCGVYNVPEVVSTATVTCMVEVDSARGTFRLSPIPDAITLADLSASEAILTYLRDNLKTTLVYHGGH